MEKRPCGANRPPTLAGSSPSGLQGGLRTGGLWTWSPNLAAPSALESKAVLEFHLSSEQGSGREGGDFAPNLGTGQRREASPVVTTRAAAHTP